MRASAALSEGVLASSMIALMSLRAACASLSTSASLASYSCLRSLYPISSGGSCIFAITIRRSARARSSNRILIRVRCAFAGMYLAVSSSSRWPTRPTINIDSTDVATMRTINPTAMATIRLLIDCLIIDPENFFKFRRVRVFEMSLPPCDSGLVMDGLKAMDRRWNALVARLQLQGKELRIMARLMQIAAVEPQAFLLRRLPHVALFTFPWAGVLCRIRAETPDLADLVGHFLTDEISDPAVHR